MDYCVRCGKSFESSSAFCPYCGAPKNRPTRPKTAPVPRPAPAPTGYTPLPAKTPGMENMDLSMVSMILSILSMAYGVVAFFAALIVMNMRYSERYAVVIMVSLLFTLPIGILGMIFCSIAKKQGMNNSSISTATILGGVSMGLYGLAFLLCIVAMV